jgi:hypothetical protein
VALLKETDEVRVYGPYLRQYKNGHWRRQVVLKYAHRSTSMSYARWLMQEALGRELLSDEHVDHVDDDRLNDDLTNLQVLTPGDNIRKSHPRKDWITFICPVCRQPATKQASKVRHNRKQGKAGPFCDKRCSRAWQVTQGRVVKSANTTGPNPVATA